jgi:hypothetical protein
MEDPSKNKKKSPKKAEDSQTKPQIIFILESFPSLTLLLKFLE